ncbi:Retrovirus-related Pol polyprotein from transposon 17.6 [Araneus ventricosus]|uniref:Retrovirus-related Pol polyprotein from transposon 17.6 n=1 Tax=Araneus ventricosus TaxID=182803 RepID=A0A4Y2A3U4_ARAVE|nr:Retrovirus-related Pol polyprotein from transposon 17.6 [Araneus ventricosus]
MWNCTARDTLTDPVPTRQKPYRVPYQLKAEMKRQINTLLDAGIIQPSKSAYAAPVLLVKKSDDSYRLVADLRKLNKPCLHLPDFSRPFSIFTDASKYSLGCVLVQEDASTGFHHPIAFASRKLGPSEISYATVEKECLALVFAITHFKNYLYGAHFNVFSDQQCLSRVKTLKDPTSRIARWFLTLQQYDNTAG